MSQITIAGKPVGPIGFGMSGLTSPRGSAPPLPTEQAIAVLKAALNAGANLWNAGVIYGTPEYNSLHLLHAYFTQYPADAAKVVISLKAGFDFRTKVQRCDAAGIQHELDNALRVLDGTCRIDIFQVARLDPAVPVETIVAAIASAVAAGKVGAIGLSEVGAASIRRAAAAAAAAALPIAAVEIELGLFETGARTNGVAAACAELAIPIVAYSPLGHGFLTGSLRTHADLPPGDYRRMFPRFAPDVFEENLRLVREVERLAAARRCSAAQIAIAWVVAQTRALGVPAIPIPGSTSPARVEENSRCVELAPAELAELERVLEGIELKGGRAPEQFSHLLNG